MPSIAGTRVSERFTMPLSYSLLLHALLAGVAVFSLSHSHSGDSWGGPGGSITVGLAGNVPAIPLPHPEISTASRVVDETKGLYKAELPKIEPPPLDALPIPKFKLAKPVPKFVTRPSKLLENPTKPPPNAIPYG